MRHGPGEKNTPRACGKNTFVARLRLVRFITLVVEYLAKQFFVYNARAYQRRQLRRRRRRCMAAAYGDVRADDRKSARRYGNTPSPCSSATVYTGAHGTPGSTNIKTERGNRYDIYILSVR